jgi:hypothetical protein
VCSLVWGQQRTPCDVEPLHDTKSLGQAPPTSHSGNGHPFWHKFGHLTVGHASLAIPTISAHHANERTIRATTGGCRDALGLAA